MDEEICPEFVAGLCPYEAFFVDSVTKECPKKHSKQLLTNNSTIDCRDELIRRALSTYCRIIDEIEKRKKNNQRSLRRIIHASSTAKALKRIEYLIEGYLLSNNMQTIHTLIALHGKILQMDSVYEIKNKYTVCNICSAFKQTDKCEHIFCKVYAQLRELIRKLSRTTKANK